MHALSLCVEEKTPPSLSLCNLVFQQSKTQNKRTSVSAHFPNHRAHPPENRRLIVNPSARPDQVQGSGGTAAVSSLYLPLSHLAFVAGLGGGGAFVDWVCWEWVTVFVLNSWVSWVNFCWVVVPIWVRVAVVGGSDLGLVCRLLRGLVCVLLVGLVTVIAPAIYTWLASDVVVDGFR
ncbi:hypothetical protein CMV_015082 [Castanea mollissima]|uniref:Transmembrane protein n=1 Tax=Castanea mollissima TaxID=60419 RepID=A0A8J4R2C3_9ROSI|nr:hypothetical protein CMV_015082 [Castanea mollissima]